MTNRQWSTNTSQQQSTFDATEEKTTINTRHRLDSGFTVLFAVLYRASVALVMTSLDGVTTDGSSKRNSSRNPMSSTILSGRCDVANHLTKPSSNACCLFGCCCRATRSACDETAAFVAHMLPSSTVHKWTTRCTQVICVAWYPF